MSGHRFRLNGGLWFRRFWLLLVVLGLAGILPLSPCYGIDPVPPDAPAQNHASKNTLPPDFQKSKAKFVPGEILIKFKPQSMAVEEDVKGKKSPKSGLKRMKASRQVLERLDRSHAPKAMGRLFHRRKLVNGISAAQKPTPSRNQAEKEKHLDRWYKMVLPEDTDIETVLATLRSDPDIELAEPNLEWQLSDLIPPVIEGLPDGTTDPLFPSQWHFADPSARIPYAWDYLKNGGAGVGGSHDVVVAVIDSGIDYTHEELVGNIWVNGGEIPANGIDDDDNGFVDDIHGCSVVSDGRSHSGDPQDFHGHGTHVAGIVAAQGFNGKGGVGVAFNVQVMGIRAAQYAGVLTVSDIAEAVIYAMDNGAEIINMSFGGYQHSQVVADALETALNQAVLVAAAGNDGAPIPMYPGALHWVIAVAASGTNGSRAWFSNAGDVMAPGMSILSTLPGNQYKPWSGTSMATPVVSGIAALMRSYFWQREIYSSRFLMGGIYNASGGGVVNAYKAVTELPTPGVTLLNNWLFDDAGIDPGNDGDGRIDSGERIHLAVELINRSGQAENVTATLRAHLQNAAQDDPHVTIESGSVHFDAIGPFATADNGFNYDDNGVIVGVDTPLVFTVAPECPNDHIIPFELTVTFQDGWNPSSPVYTRISRFQYIVQRGRNIPTVIDEDMTLTADEYWIVGGPVLIEPGATLTVDPGTQIQFGAVSSDPYNPGPQNGSILVRGGLLARGTAEAPISFFPSYLVSGQMSKVTVDGGICDLAYTKVMNPFLSRLRSVDHGYFYQDYGYGLIDADYFSNTIFHKIRWLSEPIKSGRFDACLFDAGRTRPQDNARIYNSVFLQDYEGNYPFSFSLPQDYANLLTNAFQPTEKSFTHVQTIGDSTYALMSLEWVSVPLAEVVAGYFGGHLASIADEAEEILLENYLSTATGTSAVNGGGDFYHIGLVDEGPDGIYAEHQWLDGTPFTYANWRPGYPVSATWDYRHGVTFAAKPFGQPIGFGWVNGIPKGSSRYGGGPHYEWNHAILKLPGEWTEAELHAPLASGELLDHVVENFRGDWRYNAFLNKCPSTVITAC